MAGFNLKGFDDVAFAAIESCQPYNRRHPRLPPLLSLLKAFDDLNKHRLLVPVSFVMGGPESPHKVWDIQPASAAEAEFQITWCHGEVKNGTEVVALLFPAPQDVQVTYNAHLEFGIAVPISDAPDSTIIYRNVLVLFTELADEVSTVIRSCSAVV